MVFRLSHLKFFLLSCSFTYFATVVGDGRLVLGGGELIPVVAEELDGLPVVSLLIVIPRHGIDAGVREALVGLLAQEAEEAHLYLSLIHI